jgi:DNA-binding transcriptional ArsR family regulator
MSVASIIRDLSDEKLAERVALTPAQTAAAARDLSDDDLLVAVGLASPEPPAKAKPGRKPGRKPRQLTIDAAAPAEPATADSYNYAATADAILKRLSEVDDAGVSSLAFDLRLKKPAVVKALETLVSTGKIERYGRGKGTTYKLSVAEQVDADIVKKNGAASVEERAEL